MMTQRYYRIESKVGTETIAETLAKLGRTPCSSFGCVCSTRSAAIKWAAKTLGRNKAEFYVCHISD